MLARDRAWSRLLEVVGAGEEPGTEEKSPRREETP